MEKLQLQKEDVDKKIHECIECNKFFRNGKALGGHMSSAHVQGNKDLKKKSKYSGAALICRECDKEFPCEKSLFGHMRCHPERDWRGMDPPPHPPDETSKPNLMGWGQMGRRGRPATTRSLSSSSLDKNCGKAEALDCFYKIIKLVSQVLHVPKCGTNLAEKGKAKCSNTMGKEKDDYAWLEEEEEEGRAKYFKGKAKCCKEEDVLVQQQLEEGEIHEEEVEKYDDDYEQLEDDDLMEEGEIHEEEVEKKDLLLQLEEGEIEEEVQRKRALQGPKYCQSSRGGGEKRVSELINNYYVCEICKRSFTCHQALGGHRSSHNKLKITILNTNQSCSHMLCHICNKNFPSGRALEGHMRRCHSDQAMAPHHNNAILPFDLNKMPNDYDHRVEDEQ